MEIGYKDCWRVWRYADTDLPGVLEKATLIHVGQVAESNVRVARPRIERFLFGEINPGQYGYMQCLMDEVLG